MNDSGDPALQRFLELLQCFTATNVFNPWSQRDPANDGPADPARIRTRQLRAYLRERRERARFLLVAEAAGYQGAKFTGCAMTSERILLGHQTTRGVQPAHVIASLEPVRTSRAERKPLGFNEPTATIVWGTLLGAGVDARDWVNWNAFAWHPTQPARPLSNRTPTRPELEAGRPVLEAFLALFPGRTVVAVGQHAARLLASLGVEHRPVRHPSMGGTTQFRDGILRITLG